MIIFVRFDWESFFLFRASVIRTKFRLHQFARRMRCKSDSYVVPNELRDQWVRARQPIVITNFIVYCIGFFEGHFAGHKSDFAELLTIAVASVFVCVRVNDMRWRWLSFLTHFVYFVALILSMSSVMGNNQIASQFDCLKELLCKIINQIRFHARNERIDQKQQQKSQT